MPASKQDLVDCVAGLYAMGLTTSISGNHSMRTGPNWMWITPSGIPRYSIRKTDLVKVHLRTGKVLGRMKPSIELGMHREIYNVAPDVNAVVHTHSPFTIGVSISAEFRHVIEEARIVVGTPVVIANKPSGSKDLAESVARQFALGARVIVVKNHGVVAGGKDLHHARAMIESLEEWAKILAIARIFGGPRDYLEG
ncbi:MAG TPA: class II aldolase/adducin family protein [Nitrososphaera sp.]